MIPMGVSSSSWLANVDEMKEIHGALVHTNTDMNGKVYGALVQFDCYQHGRVCCALASILG